MKIKVNHCFDDWYTVVRAEHSGRSWCEPLSENSSRFMSSERLSPEACIEGDVEQLIEVAKAIKEQKDVYFKRIAIRFEKNPCGFYFWSPKNSEHEVFISFEDANEFANEVIRKFSKS